MDRLWKQTWTVCLAWLFVATAFCGTVRSQYFDVPGWAPVDLPAASFFSTTWQPAPAQPGNGGQAQSTPPAAPPPPPRRSSLAGYPKMKGYLLSTQTFSFWTAALSLDGLVDFPSCGRNKVAENNSALPENRVYFLYNHFHNAITSDLLDGTTRVRQNASVDRYTFGFEQTFFDGWGSVEFRMPMYGNADTLYPGGFSSQNNQLGNLLINTKILLVETPSTAVAGGLAMSLPTGDCNDFILCDEVFSIQNDAVHLVPFLTFLTVPDDRTFVHGFLELDVPTAGNEVVFRNTVTGGGWNSLGAFREQLLLSIDLAVGYWLFRSPQDRGVTGVATSFEIHYATMLDDAPTLSGSTPNSDFSFGNAYNRMDLVTFTTGFDVQFNSNTLLTIAGAFPSGNDRFFDAELQLMINRSY